MLRTLHPQAKTVAAFAGLPDGVEEDLIKVMHVKTFRKGSVLFTQGEEPHALYFVQSGRVKWHKVSEDGNEQILQVVERGQAVGLVALLDRKPYVAAATVVEDATVWVLTVADFDRMVLRHPQLALLVMSMLGDGVRWLLEHVHAMSNRSAHERVASVLIRKAEPGKDGHRTIPLTHQEIAHLAGMARETVSRVLADFQRRGAVQLARNVVILLDATRFWAPQRRSQLG